MKRGNRGTKEKMGEETERRKMNGRGDREMKKERDRKQRRDMYERGDRDQERTREETERRRENKKKG